jgi:hypothetical protein
MSTITVKDGTTIFRTVSLPHIRINDTCWTMRRRKCDSTIPTNSTRPVSVGTVEKSIDVADAR